jgi:hypothetical protein
MELHTVESSMIQAFGYEAKTQTLLVIFNSSKAYRYFEVPPDVYEGLVEADSKGSYLRELVIDQYPYQLAKKPRR